MSAAAHSALGVRQATRADLPALLRLGRHMAAESWQARRLGLAWHPERAEQTARFFLQSPTALLLAFIGEGSPRGFLLATLAPYSFLEGAFSEQFMLYVAPEWRGGNFRALRTAFLLWEHWARQHGAADLYFAPSFGGAGRREDAYSAIARRLGFERVDFSWRKALVGGYVQ